MKESIKSLEFVISFDTSNELRTEVTGLNLPTGCLITTKVKYSTACAVTSEFILGVQYNNDIKDFEKMENIIDKAEWFSEDAYQKMKALWDDNKPTDWLNKGKMNE